MSRIGKKIIEIPSDVQAELTSEGVKIKGPKGELLVPVSPLTEVKIAGGQIAVARKNESREAREIHGLSRTLIANAIEGVTKGFQKQLEIFGVGFRAEVTPEGLTLSLGFSHPVKFSASLGITFSVEKNIITVSGFDKQKVGEAAAQLHHLKKPDPYKGKGIRYLGEAIKLKPGKAAKAMAGGTVGA